MPARRERGGGKGRKEGLKEVKVKEVKVKEKKEAASLVGARKEGTGMGPRKSRSKERPRVNNNNNNSSNGSSEVLLARLRKVMTMTIHRQ